MTHAYEALTEIFDSEGAKEYLGEQVSIATHMLQTAQVARDSGASAELIVAAVVHDVGHFSGAMSGLDLMRGHDNRHDAIAAEWLSQWFEPAVTEPVRLHVAAKRYLCATDAAYYDQLSDASKYTMSVQGGEMSADEVAAFAAEPHCQSATALRRFDDAGKNPDAAVPTLADFRAEIEALDRTVTSPAAI
ncbi:HD domain-containing protein [Nocardia sp. NBC_01503]|uniref:HD domain-containing protein n=1 Tax=Nocardia sp. NBC_01503 TaxID=2975997 RepID=UPI002E7B75F3|nr:HD domain-containing protein [Nocardia sp. NBC_01503]WTL30747.1 HD domain-containing protein [Nocardia sp. NBC_01503]